MRAAAMSGAGARYLGKARSARVQASLRPLFASVNGQRRIVTGHAPGAVIYDDGINVAIVFRSYFRGRLLGSQGRAVSEISAIQ